MSLGNKLSPLILVGVAIVLRDVDPSQIEKIKAILELNLGGQKVEIVPESVDQWLPESFEKLVIKRDAIEDARESSPSSNL